jgi:hypothetical protein
MVGTPSRACTRRRAAALLVASALALTACGSKSSDGSKADTTTTADKGAGTVVASTTTTTKPAATTTTTSTIPASPQTITGTMTAADLGGDWRDYPGKPVGKAGPSEKGGSCGKVEPPKAKAYSQGKILQKGKYLRYEQSTTWQFTNAADAEAFAQYRVSDAYIECDRSGTEANLAKEPKQTVKTYGVDRSKAAGAYRGQYQFEFDQEYKGKQTYAGAYSTHTVYRKGLVVIDLYLQQVDQQSDPKTLGDTVSAEVDAGRDKVLARIPA